MGTCKRERERESDGLREITGQLRAELIICGSDYMLTHFLQVDQRCQACADFDTPSAGKVMDLGHGSRGRV